MSDLSNNIAILTYLKDKVHKWKNISILLAVISILLLIRLIIGNDVSGKIETGSYIAQIKIEGTIFEDEYRSKVLKKIAEDDSAKAVIVNIDSPGGGIVGSEILYSELRKIAEKKPLIAVMHSVAASGGYMAAIASDHIIAHNGTLTGSIGVLIQAPELVGLANKLGVNFRSYKSAPLKASPSPFEKSNKYIDSVVQASVKDSAEFFFDLVKLRRNKKLAKSRTIFDGRAFTGRQALKVGLIDELGNNDSALAFLKKEHKIDSESIHVREIKTHKPTDKILEKLSSFIPFFEPLKVSNERQIMAIMPF